MDTLSAINIQASDADNIYQIAAVNLGKDASGSARASFDDRQWPIGGGNLTENRLSLYGIVYSASSRRLEGSFNAFGQTGLFSVSWSAPSDPPTVTFEVSHLWFGNRAPETHSISAEAWRQLSQFAAGF